MRTWEIQFNPVEGRQAYKTIRADRVRIDPTEDYVQFFTGDPGYLVFAAHVRAVDTIEDTTDVRPPIESIAEIYRDVLPVDSDHVDPWGTRDIRTVARRLDVDPVFAVGSVWAVPDEAGAYEDGPLSSSQRAARNDRIPMGDSMVPNSILTDVGIRAVRDAAELARGYVAVSRDAALAWINGTTS